MVSNLSLMIISKFRFCRSNILKLTGLTCNQINYIRWVTIHTMINRVLLVATSMFKPVPYNMIIANFTSPWSAFVHTTLFTFGCWLLLYSCSSRANGMSVLHPLAWQGPYCKCWWLSLALTNKSVCNCPNLFTTLRSKNSVSSIQHFEVNLMV